MTLFRVLIILPFFTAFQVGLLPVRNCIATLGFGARVDTPHQKQQGDHNKKGQRYLKNKGEGAVPLCKSEHSTMPI